MMVKPMHLFNKLNDKHFLNLRQFLFLFCYRTLIQIILRHRTCHFALYRTAQNMTSLDN